MLFSKWMWIREAVGSATGQGAKETDGWMDGPVAFGLMCGIHSDDERKPWMEGGL